MVDGGEEKVEAKEGTEWDSELRNPVNNAGYIVYKDRKTVILYSKDLASMPPEWFCPGNSHEDCIACVHGLAPLP
jgi:hypothetical protein